MGLVYIYVCTTFVPVATGFQEGKLGFLEAELHLVMSWQECSELNPYLLQEQESLLNNEQSI